MYVCVYIYPTHLSSWTDKPREAGGAAGPYIYIYIHVFIYFYMYGMYLYIYVYPTHLSSWTKKPREAGGADAPSPGCWVAAAMSAGPPWLLAGSDARI